MKIITSIKEMQMLSDSYRQQGKRIGVVPTMGYLHEGHCSLLRTMRKNCDVLVMTLFINPTQFGPSEDYDKYPRDFQRDRQLAEKEGTDIIFTPSAEEMYPPDFRTFVDVPGMSEVMCGKFRPGHFKGVATVVAKLFSIIKPHSAIFGQKDAQQVAILKKMVRDLNFDIEILVNPIIREQDGLAMSSRNVYLKTNERKESLALSQSLFLANELIVKGVTSAENLKQKMEEFIQNYSLIKLEYIAVVNPDTLEPVKRIENSVLIALAARVGVARLIDNLLIKI